MPRRDDRDDARFIFEEDGARENATKYLFMFADKGREPLLKIIKKTGPSIYCRFDSETFMIIAGDGKTPTMIPIYPKGYPGASDPAISHVDLGDISELSVIEDI